MRQSGRSTRMLRDAAKKAIEGKSVYIILTNKHHVSLVKSTYEEMGINYQKLGIKLETPETPGNFDLESCRLIGAHPNCEVLVDHNVIESKYPVMIDMLRKYDQ